MCQLDIFYVQGLDSRHPIVLGQTLLGGFYSKFGSTEKSFYADLRLRGNGCDFSNYFGRSVCCYFIFLGGETESAHLNIDGPRWCGQAPQHSCDVSWGT